MTETHCHRWCERYPASLEWDIACGRASSTRAHDLQQQFHSTWNRDHENPLPTDVEALAMWRALHGGSGYVTLDTIVEGWSAPALGLAGIDPPYRGLRGDWRTLAAPARATRVPWPTLWYAVQPDDWRAQVRELCHDRAYNALTLARSLSASVGADWAPHGMARAMHVTPERAIAMTRELAEHGIHAVWVLSGEYPPHGFDGQRWREEAGAWLDRVVPALPTSIVWPWLDPGVMDLNTAIGLQKWIASRWRVCQLWAAKCVPLDGPTEGVVVAASGEDNKALRHLWADAVQRNVPVVLARVDRWQEGESFSRARAEPARKLGVGSWLHGGPGADLSSRPTSPSDAA